MGEYKLIHLNLLNTRGEILRWFLTLHFDTTNRQQIKRERPSIRLRMKSGELRPFLRPLSRIVETRENI